MINTCYTCKFHETFIEEDGTNDGCICLHDEGSKKYHINNCDEYTTECKGCPFWEEA